MRMLSMPRIASRNCATRAAPFGIAGPAYDSRWLVATKKRTPLPAPASKMPPIRSRPCVLPGSSARAIGLPATRSGLRSSSSV